MPKKNHRAMASAKAIKRLQQKLNLGPATVADTSGSSLSNCQLRRAIPAAPLRMPGSPQLEVSSMRSMSTSQD